MKTNRAGSRILTALVMVAMLAGCSGENAASESVTNDKTERNGKYVVGEGILEEDITEFAYTFSSTANPPEYEEYRFLEEDGTYRFSFFQETVEEDGRPESEERTSVSGMLELTDEEWDAFFDCLEGGRVQKNEVDRPDGKTYSYQLYWNGDREKYRAFSFASARMERKFEDLCAEFTARADLSVSGDTGTGKTTQKDADVASLPEPYKQVLQMFRNALNGMDVTDAMPADAFLSYEFTSCMYDLPYAGDMYDEADGGYGYALIDLDENGVEELLIGRNEAYTSVHTEEQQTSSSVIAVFTLSDGEDVQAIPVIFGFLRSTYFLTKDNTFVHYGSMGAMDAYAGEWVLDHTDLVQQGDGVRVYYDFESDNDEDVFYRLSPGADLYDLDEADLITEEEYSAYLERLEEKQTTVSFQKIESSYGVEAWSYSPDANAFGGKGIQIFGGQYQNDYAGVVSNIWDQSTGIVFSFGIDNASFQGSATYDERSGQLRFDAIDYSTDATVSGYAEMDGNTLRVTFTASDNEHIAAGDVYTLDRVP